MVPALIVLASWIASGLVLNYLMERLSGNSDAPGILLALIAGPFTPVVELHRQRAKKDGPDGRGPQDLF